MEKVFRENVGFSGGNVGFGSVKWEKEQWS